MLEILVLAIAFLVMAKGKPRARRRMGRYIRGNVDEQLNLSTLASKTLISAAFDETVNERTLVSSIVASWSLQAFTPATGDGPVLVGVAHGDYSSAEIEAFLETTGSWNEGDLVAQEVGKRRIRRVGVLGATTGPLTPSSLNDGKPIKTKLNWILLQGQTLQVWAYNMGSSALETTNPVVDVQGHANLWPR